MEAARLCENVRTEIHGNKQLWDAWTPSHLRSSVYDVDSFRRGGISLTPLEVEEVGSVKGKTLLHLQCHFGLDTLSWVRLGAEATGVDFSGVSIRAARELAESVRVPARFVEADVEDSALDLGQRFDIVYTSYGALSWINDLHSWADVIARHLKPGGFFYMVELHPILGMLDDQGKHLKYPYFPSKEALVSEESGSYAGAEHGPMKCYQWSHSVGEIVTTLIDRGLSLVYVHEFPYSTQNCYPFLVQADPGRYVVQDYPGLLPLMFSIRATR